jgi:tetratricopeptide (TPR) repeat protein
VIKAIKNAYYNSFEQPASLAIVGSISGIAVISLFSYPLRDFVILSYLIILISTIRDPNEKLMEFNFSPLVKKTIILTLLMIIGCISLINIYLVDAQYKWEKIAFSSDNSYTRLKKYIDIYPALDNNGSFLYNYGVELSINNKYAESLALLERAKKYFTNTDLLIYSGDDYLGLNNHEKAREQYSKAITMVPKKFLPRYALMQFYQAIHDKKAADSLAERILTERIIYPSVEVNTIKAQSLELLKSCNN